MTWPEYDQTSNLFANLDNQITTMKAPGLSIHEDIVATMYPARRRKVEADQPVVKKACDSKNATNDDVNNIGNTSSTKAMIGNMVLIPMLISIQWFC